MSEDSSSVVNAAPILAQRYDVFQEPQKPDSRNIGAWYSTARLGMFIHYGLYSILGRGEWEMFYAKIPTETYNKLFYKFNAEKFDASRLVRLAKVAGCGYVVLGARHHEGFCLYDTKTTSFNSVESPCGRDLIREYCEACRQAGLRVGIYYSVMSWQWPAIHTGPQVDPMGWEAMVRETHEQVRELMSNYGQIDVLWYDGCMVPGVSDLGQIASYWRSHELEAMVRRLQPGILINDRAALPGDFLTPEQDLSLPPRGRRWEWCMTINDHWGWFDGDENYKSPETLLRHLVFCARHDGNFLPNVGPHPDGSIPEPYVRILDKVGEWMECNGDSVRGSQRTDYTEAEHLLGAVTSSRSSLYFHLFDKPQDKPSSVAGITKKIISARLLASGSPIRVDMKNNGIAQLSGLTSTWPSLAPAVIAIDFESSAPIEPPPSLLLEKETGRWDPAEAPVRDIDQVGLRSSHEVTLEAEFTGSYRFEFMVESARLDCFTLAIDGMPVELQRELKCAEYPDTLIWPAPMIPEGRHTLALSACQPFALLKWRAQPAWHQLLSDQWTIIGPFPSPYRIPGDPADVKTGLETVFPPEEEFNPAAHYVGAGGHDVHWQKEDAVLPTIDFGRVSGSRENGVYYARTVIHSNVERSAGILMGCDWWANLYVNGELVRSERSPELVSKDGAWFCKWKPLAARIHLKPGANVLLVKCHQGRAGNWFSFHINPSEI